MTASPDDHIPHDEMRITPQHLATRYRVYDLAQVNDCRVAVDQTSWLIRTGAWTAGIAVTLGFIIMVVAKGFPNSNRALHMLLAGPLILIWAATCKLTYVLNATVEGETVELMRSKDEGFADNMRRLVEHMKESTGAGYRIDLKAERIISLA
jgi:hypothetical protein